MKTSFLISTDAAHCFVVSQLPQSTQHSKSADLLRESLLSHVRRVSMSNALSCRHEGHFDLETLVS